MFDLLQKILIIVTLQQIVNKLVDIFKKLIYNRVKQGCSARKRNLPCQIIILIKKINKM